MGSESRPERHWKKEFLTTLHLIRAVKHKPALWNSYHYMNSNERIKEALWEEIAAKFRTDVEDVQTRWSRLKTAYGLRLRQKGFDITKWPYYKEMAFFRAELNLLIRAGAFDDRPEPTEPVTLSSDSESDDCLVIDEQADVTILDRSSSPHQETPPQSETLTVAAQLSAIDPDAAMLASCLPLLKQIPPTKKLAFIEELHKLIKTYTS